MKATLSPAKLASLKQRRLRTLRLHPPLYARPLRPFPESSAFSYDCRYRLFFPFFSLFLLHFPFCFLVSPFYFFVPPFYIPQPRRGRALLCPPAKITNTIPPFHIKSSTSPTSLCIIHQHHLFLCSFISSISLLHPQPRRGRALLCPPAKDHTPIALYILFYIYRILYITSYISHHINNINHRYRQSPKSRSGSAPGLSWRALSAVTVVSARSVCCLSEASFRRDSERRKRSSSSA